MLFFLSLFLSLFSVKPAYAAGEFNAVQTINYTIDNNGDASVSQDIELSNNYSEIYPKEYQVSLSGPSITNIQGNDDKGNIVVKSDQMNETTVIYLKFNQANVGQHKVTKFKLNYTIPKLATHKGNVWELPLPEYKNTQATDTININLLVPESFGTMSFSSVNTTNSVILNQQTQIQFNLNNITDKKILFIFGNYQVFDFNFKYFLNNTTDKISHTEIAIPPETDSQKVIFKDINPRPVKVNIDSDGNWLAQYDLPPQEKIEVNVSGQAKIFSSTINDPNIDKKSLLQSKNFWPVNDPTIQEIASTLKSPKDIYNYVINNLNYGYDSFNTATRKGALGALNDPANSLCTEFTDLFVTLARAKGIPAREIEGFAYTNNPKIKPINLNADILHAWPQYYNSISQKWVSIDPTWAKTTNGIDYFSDLDLNHFIFVIHGKDSQYPSPPGSYKNNQNIKTVSVEFATKDLKESYLPPKLTSEKTRINENPEIVLTNINPNALTDLKITLDNQNWSYQIPVIPPYASVTLKIPNLNFVKTLLPQSHNLNFKVDYKNSDKPATYAVFYPTHYLNLSIVIALAIVILSTGGIILTGKFKHK